MRARLLLLLAWLTTAALWQPADVHAQDAAYAKNFQTCLRGTTPSLCNHARLTGEDAERVRQAEYLENLRTCLRGTAPGLCKHAKLSSADTAKVRGAEYQANLRTCLRGVSSLCKHGLLKPTDVEGVRKAEYGTNLRACLRGSVGCNTQKLEGPDQQKAAEAKAERQAQITARAAARTEAIASKATGPAAVTSKATRPAAVAPVLPSDLSVGRGPCAENGSCYGDISKITGRSKTVAVRGYYRRDGTYVRGHYRSRGR